MIYIFWTCRDSAEAKKIIHTLLDERLIASASIFPEVGSIYRWEGKIEESKEVKVILKTQPKHFEAVRSCIETNCSSEVPEILRVDVPQGNPRYLSWVVEETESLNAKEGKSLITLGPINKKDQRKLGVLKGKIKLTKDFDAPLSEEHLTDFEK